MTPAKPKIAVLIDWYLPGTKAGGPVRSVYSLIELLKQHVDFYLITTNKDLGSEEEYTAIKANTWLSRQDIHMFYFDSKGQQGSAITDLIKALHPDLIYLNSFWSYPFSISLIRLKHRNQLDAPILLAPRGMLSPGALGLKSFKKKVYLTLARIMGWYSSIRFHATHEGEIADIRREFKQAQILQAPNVNALPVCQNKSPKEKKSLNLFYLSRIAKVKNLHSALEILKRIPAGYNIHYHIFGNLEDTDYWKECLQLIKQLPSHVQVEYKGEIAFDAIQATLIHYHALFLPTLNENYGHSIVESLLCGCPVIISDQTPWNDLRQNDAGFTFPIQNQQAYLEAILALADLDDAGFRQKSDAANNYISKKINLESITNQYLTLINDCLKNRSVNL